MKPFHITRIHLNQGIFKITGEWLGIHDSSAISLQSLTLSKLEMMGSDGWLALDLSQEIVCKLMGEIKPQVLTHLLSQSK